MTQKLFFIGHLIFVIFISATIFGQTDPNADQNWDWRNGDDPNLTYPGSIYTMYRENGDGSVSAVSRSAPWNQWNAWDGLDDNRPEDGWRLVCRDFGTPTRPILGAEYINDRPYFIIYNKYTALLKVFILVKAQNDYSSGAITVKFGSTTKSATLTHLKGRAYAADKLDITGQYAGTGLTDVVGDDMWAWAEFPLAYDPTMQQTSSSTGPRLVFQVIGTSESNLEVEGELVGVTGTDKLVRKFLTHEANGMVTASDLIEETVGQSYSFSDLSTYVSGRAKDWDNWKKFLDKSYNALPTHEEGGYFEGASNNFKYLIGELKNSWLVDNLPVISQVSGLFSYVLGGGRSLDKNKTAPMFIGERIKLNGTITTLHKLPSGASVPIPGSRIDPSTPAYSSNVPLLYNTQPGLINLKTTPILEYKTYQQQVAIGYPYHMYGDFRLKNNIDYEFNNLTELGLELVEIKSWIVMDVTANVNKTNAADDSDLELMSSWSEDSEFNMEVELFTENSFSFRTIPVHPDISKYQRIKGHNRRFISPGFYQDGITPDMTIKIKAVFRRIDDPTAIPIVTILTYEPDFEYAGQGNWPEPPLPFEVNITREFEFDSDQIQPTEFGFVGENKTVEVPSTINNYQFVGWSDGLKLNPRNFSATTNIDAIYKVVNQSNEDGAISRGSNKFEQSADGTLHKVYESMGKVWYEVSTNSGSTWSIMNGGKPLSNTEAKNPAIYEADPYCYITFQENNNGSAAIKLQIQNFRTNSLEAEEIFYSNTNDYSFDTNPVVFLSEYDGLGYVLMLVYRKYSANAFDPVEGLMLSISKSESLYDLSFGQMGVPYIQKIPYTSVGSNYLDIANDRNYNHINGNIFHLTWEQETSTTTSVLKYQQLSFDYSNNTISYCPSVPDEPSLGSGYTKNYSPSIVVMEDNLPRLTWLGEKTVDQDDEEEQRKIGSTEGSGIIEKKVILRGRNSSYWNSGFWKYGNDPNSVSMNYNESGTIGGYAFAWSEGSPTITGHKSVANTRINWSPVNIAGAAGKDIHLSNGDALEDMHTMGLDAAALPYELVLSDHLTEDAQSGGQGELKVAANTIQSVGREGLINYNESVFFFEVNDILLDGEIIEFEPLSDTTNFNDLISLNSYLESLPFEVNNNSQLAYSVKYGVVSEEEQILEEGDFINYKVQLVDNVSNEVLGTYDNVTFNENNLELYDNINYIIETAGIGSRTVKMKLVVDYNVEADPNLATIFCESNLLEKTGAVTLSYNGAGQVTTYDLSQNYPNPFNPTTTIKYQIPNAGNVSLKIYDILGAEVMTLVNTTQAKGRYEVKFDASQLSSGVYIYRIQAEDYVASRKMMLLK